MTKGNEPVSGSFELHATAEEAKLAGAGFTSSTGASLDEAADDECPGGAFGIGGMNGSEDEVWAGLIGAALTGIDEEPTARCSKFSGGAFTPGAGIPAAWNGAGAALACSA